MKKDTSNKNTFHFFTPASSIIKAKGANNEDIMRLGGIASTMDRDSDGEFLDPNGFDVSYLQKSGFVNWHHGVKDNPSTIIGEPSKVTLTNKGLNIEVDLYKDSALAKQVYDLAMVLQKNSTSRGLGFSIEGKAIERDLINPKIIKKARITGVAITHMPKNPQTFASIIKGEVDDFEDDTEELLSKSLKAQLMDAKIALADQILKAKETGNLEKDEDTDEDEETTEKSLSTESDSGGALKREHVDGQEKKITKSEIFALIFESYPEIEIQKSKRVYNIIQKLSEMKSQSETPSSEDIKKAMEILNVLDNMKEEGSDDDLNKAEDAEDDSEDEGEDEAKKDKKPAAKKEDDDEDDGEKKPNNFEKSDKTVLFVKNEDGYFQKGNVAESGEFEPISDSLYEKVEGNFIKKSEEIVTESTEDIINKAVSRAEDRFAEILSQQTETIDTLKGQLEQVANQRNGRRSFQSVNQIEKSFMNGEEDGIQKAGGSDGKVVSLSRNRGMVTQMLEKAAFSDLNKGISTRIDPSFEKAINVFETSGTMPADIRRKIEAQENIVLEA